MKTFDNMHIAFIAIIIGLIACTQIDGTLQNIEQNVHFQINVERERTKNFSRFTLDCSSMEHPFGQSAEFLINNETKANIRHINGTCAINRGICKKNECSCTNRTFVWSFIGHEDFWHRTFTCLFRFHQKNMNRHLLVYKTKTYEGSEISEEKTRIDQIKISTSNSTTNSTNSYSNSVNYVPIYICVCIALPLVASAVPLSWMLRIKYCKGDDLQANKDQSTLAEALPLNQNNSTEINIPTVGNSSNISNRLPEDIEHPIVIETDHVPSPSVELQTTDEISNRLNSSHKSNGFYTDEAHSPVDEAANIADPSGELKTTNGLSHNRTSANITDGLKTEKAT